MKKTSNSVRLKKVLPLLPIMGVALLIIYLPMMIASAQSIHTIIENVCPKFLEAKLVNYTVYYVIFAAITALLILVIIHIWHHNQYNVKRDAKYLHDILHSDNERLPVVDINELVKRITGLKTRKEDIAAYDETHDMLMKNITPIVKFLNGNVKAGAILTVDAPWGAGKTTAILIAIDQNQKQQKKQNVLRRYIYESAFKYTSNTGDFGRDIVSALHDTLSELGLNAQDNLIGIMQNIEFSASGLIPSLLKSIKRKPEDTLTTELINKINSIYRDRFKETNHSLEIIIILDDIDRLQGEDIIKALSLLSIMRRLDFVKIIISVDSHSIIYQLDKQCHIENPDRFIKKYLPKQKAVRLESGEEIVEQITLRKIKSLQDNFPGDNTEFCAAWAAIIIWLVSDKLHGNPKLENEQDFHKQWLGRFEYMSIPSTKMPEISEASCRILLSDSSNEIDRIVMNAHSSYGKKYKWPNNLKTDIRNFEDIILKLQRGNGLPVIQNLTEEEYDELIGSWIFNFARQDWLQIGATLRDVLDLILENDFSNLSLDRAEQFKQVLSQLFPKSAGMIWGTSE